MIEILPIPARESKGSKNDRNYHFFTQKAKLTSKTFDGVEEVRVIDVQSNPGELYEPADDYIVDPASLYIGTNAKGYEQIMVRRSPKLVRVSQLAGQTNKPSQLKVA